MEQQVFNEDQIITFKEGIPGFEHLTKFIILEEGDGVFYYLQAIQDVNVVFPIVSPYLIKPDYAPTIHESYFEKLGGGVSEDFTLYTIATIRENLQESTINLQAPLLIQVEKRIGIQTIVEDKNYVTRHKIAELLQERGA